MRQKYPFYIFAGPYHLLAASLSATQKYSEPEGKPDSCTFCKTQIFKVIGDKVYCAACNQPYPGPLT